MFEEPVQLAPVPMQQQPMQQQPVQQQPVQQQPVQQQPVLPVPVLPVPVLPVPVPVPPAENPDSFSASSYFPSRESEIWTLYNDPAGLHNNSLDTCALLVDEMSRCILYTVNPKYLLGTLLASQPIVFVRHVNGTLLGFACLNKETVSVPDAVLDAWSGAGAFKVPAKSSKAFKAAGSSGLLKDVVHMSIFGVSPFSPRESELGKRLMSSVKSIAAGLDAKLVLIEALSALKTYYNKGSDFQTTVPSFFKANGYGLVAMVFKTDFEACGPIACLVEPCATKSAAELEALYNTELPETPELAECVLMSEQVVGFLTTKDPLTAALTLRSIALRSDMKPEEYLKLWNFRNKCINGQRQNVHEFFEVIEKF